MFIIRYLFGTYCTVPRGVYTDGTVLYGYDILLYEEEDRRSTYYMLTYCKVRLTHSFVELLRTIWVLFTSRLIYIQSTYQYHRILRSYFIQTEDRKKSTNMIENYECTTGSGAERHTGACLDSRLAWLGFGLAWLGLAWIGSALSSHTRNVSFSIITETLDPEAPRERRDSTCTTPR